MANGSYRVEWSERATADLLQAAAFIRQRNPSAAKRFYKEMLRKTRHLEAHPRLGRIVPEYENELRRELIYPPYRIIYEVFPDERKVEISAVVHSSRLLVF